MINKIIKIVYSLAFWFVLMLMQTSFLSIYTDFNLIILLIIVINLIEDPENNFGFISSLFGGLLLDLNTTYPFGLFTIGCILFWLIIKIILLKFLRIPYVSWLPKI
jgi:cell shape-determining protein MreD